MTTPSPKTQPFKLVNEKVWCSLCENTTQLLRVKKAAELMDVNARAIYRYIEAGLVNSTKVAGKSRRLCGNCLLRLR